MAATIRRPARRPALTALAITLTYGFVSAAFAGDAVIFSNRNKGGVRNLRTPAFSITVPTIITRINTYHWNGGKGTPEPGRIGIRGVGSWAATGSPGMQRTPNAEWTVHPNVTLQPGT